MEIMWKISRIRPIPSQLLQFQKKWEDYPPPFKATILFWSDCSYLNFKCRVTSWTLSIEFQNSANIQTLYNYFNWNTHNPSKLRPFQIKHMYSKPSTESDPNATIPSETHNPGQSYLFNWIPYSLNKLQPFQWQHVHSKKSVTSLVEMCKVKANWEYDSWNEHNLSKLQLFQVKHAYEPIWLFHLKQAKSDLIIATTIKRNMHILSQRKLVQLKLWANCKYSNWNVRLNGTILSSFIVHA